MPYKFDSEEMLDYILGIMQDDDVLNNKIAAVEAEKEDAGKGLSPTLAPIAEYHLQTWNDKILQRTPAIFYGIEDVTAVDGMGAVAKTYKCFIEVVIVDNNQTNDGHKRISRYSRSLEELFTSNFKPEGAMGAVKVESVRPISFKLEMNTDEEIRVGGISLTISLF